MSTPGEIEAERTLHRYVDIEPEAMGNITRAIAALLAEYDRRGECLKGRDVEQHALRNAISRISAQEDELDRLRRVESAARALVEHWASAGAATTDRPFLSVTGDLLDDLARELGTSRYSLRQDGAQ